MGEKKDTYREKRDEYKRLLDQRLVSLEVAEAEVSNAAYSAVVKLFEGAEHRGKVTGNGHHMAQQISTAAAQLMRERWREDD